MSEPSGGPPATDHRAHTRRVFVVHLRADVNPAGERMAGRIEHVRSRDAAHFESVDELVAFIAACIAAVPE